MKLIYAAVFAFSPLAAPAQTFDSSLLSALCNDDYMQIQLVSAAPEKF